MIITWRYRTLVMLYYMFFSSLPIGTCQWPITSSITPTVLSTWTSYFNNNWVFTFLSVFILTEPVNFPVGGNRSVRRKPTTFGRVLTNSFHMSGALDSNNVLAENRTRNFRGERRVPDYCATEAPQLPRSRPYKPVAWVLIPLPSCSGETWRLGCTRNSNINIQGSCRSLNPLKST